MTTPELFFAIRPETPLRAARAEDHERIDRMLAANPENWSDEDVDVVMSRAQTTIGGPETFKWILPAFLDRCLANPKRGWMTDSNDLVSKLDYAHFDNWPADQQRAALAMLNNWANAWSRLHVGDITDSADDDAVLRNWLKARST